MKKNKDVIYLADMINKKYNNLYFYFKNYKEID